MEQIIIDNAVTQFIHGTQTGREKKSRKKYYQETVTVRLFRDLISSIQPYVMESVADDDVISRICEWVKNLQETNYMQRFHLGRKIRLVFPKTSPEFINALRNGQNSLGIEESVKDYSERVNKRVVELRDQGKLDQGKRFHPKTPWVAFMQLMSKSVGNISDLDEARVKKAASLRGEFVPLRAIGVEQLQGCKFTFEQIKAMFTGEPGDGSVIEKDTLVRPENYQEDILKKLKDDPQISNKSTKAPGNSFTANINLTLIESFLSAISPFLLTSPICDELRKRVIEWKTETCPTYRGRYMLRKYLSSVCPDFSNNSLCKFMIRLYIPPDRIQEVDRIISRCKTRLTELNESGEYLGAVLQSRSEVLDVIYRVKAMKTSLDEVNLHALTEIYIGGSQYVFSVQRAIVIECMQSRYTFSQLKGFADERKKGISYFKKVRTLVKPRFTREEYFDYCEALELVSLETLPDLERLNSAVRSLGVNCKRAAKRLKALLTHQNRGDEIPAFDRLLGRFTDLTILESISSRSSWCKNLVEDTLREACEDAKWGCDDLASFSLTSFSERTKYVLGTLFGYIDTRVTQKYADQVAGEPLEWFFTTASYEMICQMIVDYTLSRNHRDIRMSPSNGKTKKYDRPIQAMIRLFKTIANKHVACKKVDRLRTQDIISLVKRCIPDSNICDDRPIPMDEDEDEDEGDEEDGEIGEDGEDGEIEEDGDEPSLKKQKL